MLIFYNTDHQNMDSNVRKIGKIGYTRPLSLPLFWLRSVGLDAGDHVELTIGKNKELIVKPYKGDKIEDKRTMEERS